ncbi:MAG TPA: insulinase family protein [Candidatus Polarisedimenticolaceae bacterium]|nr:insulinase family protein [Candidatus Polarisedimenticolaceae bacterium]
MALPALLLAAALAPFTLGDGTEGVLVEDHREPVVTIVVELPAGRFSPWAAKHHAVEAFELMDRDPQRALGRRADALAVALSLDVGARASTLRVTCLKANLDQAVALVRDVLANPSYDKDELVRAKREQEILWRGRTTDVGFRVRQAAARALYAEGDPRLIPYEKPQAIETDPAALAQTRDALLRLPGRIVGVAGDVTAEEALRLAAGLLPPPVHEAPEDLAPRYLPLREAPPAASSDVKVRRLTQVYFLDARDSIPWDDVRRAAFRIADHVLAGHFYARLWVALRHEAGDTYGVATVDEGGPKTGLYGAATYTRVANSAAIEAKLRAAMEKFAKEGITEAERADAAGYLLGHRAFDRQAPEQILSRFLSERRAGLAPGALDAIDDRAAALPLDEVNAFIRAYYDPAKFTMIRAVPE